MSIFDDVKKAIETVIAPDIQIIKSDLKAMNREMDLRFKALDDRFDDLIDRLELKKRIEKLERELHEEKAGTN
jgi:hypothetical protein